MDIFNCTSIQHPALRQACAQRASQASASALRPRADQPVAQAQASPTSFREAYSGTAKQVSEAFTAADYGTSLAALLARREAGRTGDAALRRTLEELGEAGSKFADRLGKYSDASTIASALTADDPIKQSFTAAVEVGLPLAAGVIAGPAGSRVAELAAPMIAERIHDPMVMDASLECIRRHGDLEASLQSPVDFAHAFGNQMLCDFEALVDPAAILREEWLSDGLRPEGQDDAGADLPPFIAGPDPLEGDGLTLRDIEQELESRFGSSQGLIGMTDLDGSPLLGDDGFREIGPPEPSLDDGELFERF